MTSERLPRTSGPVTRSYSMPCSSSAFLTTSQGWMPSLNHVSPQVWSFTAMVASVRRC